MARNIRDKDDVDNLSRDSINDTEPSAKPKRFRGPGKKKDKKPKVKRIRTADQKARKKVTDAARRKRLKEGQWSERTEEKLRE